MTYLRDVVDRNHLRNEEGMRELMRILASSVAGSTNPNKIADTFKSVAKLRITETTVRQYIAYLQNAFLVEEALRYDIKGRRYIGAENKYYFVDPGIRNAVLNFRQIDDGHLMENIIYNELRAHARVFGRCGKSGNVANSEWEACEKKSGSGFCGQSGQPAILYPICL